MHLRGLIYKKYIYKNNIWSIPQYGVTLEEATKLRLRIWAHCSSLLYPLFLGMRYNVVLSLECVAGRCISRDSSVGRASDWRSEGPWFNPGSRQFFFYISYSEQSKHVLDTEMLNVFSLMWTGESCKILKCFLAFNSCWVKHYGARLDYQIPMGISSKISSSLKFFRLHRVID